MENTHNELWDCHSILSGKNVQALLQGGETQATVVHSVEFWLGKRLRFTEQCKKKKKELLFAGMWKVPCVISSVLITIYVWENNQRPRKEACARNTGETVIRITRRKGSQVVDRILKGDCPVAGKIISRVNAVLELPNKTLTQEIKSFFR